MIVFYLTNFILAQRQQEHADVLELGCEGRSRGIQELSRGLRQIGGPGWCPLSGTWTLRGERVGWSLGLQGNI